MCARVCVFSSRSYLCACVATAGDIAGACSALERVMVSREQWLGPQATGTAEATLVLGLVLEVRSLFVCCRLFVCLFVECLIGTDAVVLSAVLIGFVL